MCVVMHHQPTWAKPPAQGNPGSNPRHDRVRFLMSLACRFRSERPGFDSGFGSTAFRGIGRCRTWNTCPLFFTSQRLDVIYGNRSSHLQSSQGNNGRCATRFIAHPPRCGLLWDWNSQSWYSVTPRHSLTSGGAPIQHVVRYNGIGERNCQ